MILDQQSLLEMFHQVTHNSVWGIICRKATLNDLDSLVMSLKSQLKDNPLMMRSIIGTELYNVVNNITEIQ